jgi:hypothetical protein
MSRQRFKLVVSFVVATSAMSFCGCGKSSSQPETTGNASGSSGHTAGGVANGAGNNGAATAGATGGEMASGGTASGGATSGETPAEACIAYATAVCQRRAICKGSSYVSCAVDSCPDLTFSSGSTRTAANLKACAETYATLPCEQVALDILPPCVTPGTRQVGEACKFPSQCASLYCGMNNGSTCGTCRELVGVGQACSPAGAGCVGGSYCTDQGLCAPQPAYTPPKPLGAPCVVTDLCGSDAICTEGICAQPRGENTECTGAALCGDDFGCSMIDMRCHALPTQGQPCLQDIGRNKNLCADGSCRLTAPDTAGTCGPYAKLGELCVEPIAGSQALMVLECAPGTHCGGEPQGPTCVPDGSYGAPCTDDECQDGFDCECPMGQPSCDYGSRTCHKHGNLGDPCTPEDTCRGPFTCDKDHCASGPNQGLFEQACGTQ